MVAPRRAGRGDRLGGACVRLVGRDGAQRRADIPHSAVAVAGTSAAALAVGAVLRTDARTRLGLEFSAATAYSLAVLLALPDAAGLSGVLAIGAVTAAALALEPARRQVASSPRRWRRRYRGRRPAPSAGRSRSRRSRSP
jgi:hypothetical protein